MNMPKFAYDNTPLFKGLIGDLFPGMDPAQAIRKE
jgi:dynein heavy chain